MIYIELVVFIEEIFVWIVRCSFKFWGLIDYNLVCCMRMDW